MSPSHHLTVRIDLARVAANAQAIRARVGVNVLAVVKADAYGHGADRVVRALADVVDGYCVFRLDEAASASIAKVTGKDCLVLGPNPGVGAEDFVAQRARPAVWDVERASALRAARPVLAVDTGMQRFCTPANQIDAVLAAGGCDQAFTHATHLDRVDLLLNLVGNRGLKLHAAGSSLIDEPRARLDAVRPGLAIYRGAARVSARLVETHKSYGPAGYSGFISAYHGVILAGYSNYLRPGPCLINGRRSRVIEVGMQTSFVETTAADCAGDEVVLLGDTLTEVEIAAEWKTSPHEALTRLCYAGLREYLPAT